MTMMTAQAGDPGFEDPTELLLACHDKVRHFTRLTVKLQSRLASLCGQQQTRTGGSSAEAAVVQQDAMEAASRILRYFRIAAPLHHQDEEQDLFPALLQLDRSCLVREKEQDLQADISQLQAEHPQLEQIWSQIEPWLESVAQGQMLPTFAPLDSFVELYDAHMQREQDKVFPLTSLLSAPRRRQICARMAQRRGLSIQTESRNHVV